MDSTLRLENITKVLGHREVLKGVTFSLNKGDIFGYLGSNGAGKTTTIRIILDLLKPTSGELVVLGEKADKREIRNKIGFMLDADGLYNNMSPVENLVFYSKIYGLNDNMATIKKLIEFVGLKNRMSEKVFKFSKGMRQRLSFARALVHNPQIIILDEPLSGIDPPGRIEFRKLMLEVAQSENKTIFLSSHDLSEVEKLCNRVALIDQGIIRSQGDLDTLKKNMDTGVVTICFDGQLSDTLIAEIKGKDNFGYQNLNENELRFAPKAKVSDLVSFLAGQGVKIRSVNKQEASLEDVYSSILKSEEK